MKQLVSSAALRRGVASAWRAPARALLLAGAGLLAKAPAAAQSWQPLALITQPMRDAGIAPGGEGGQWLRALAIGANDPNFLLMGTDVGGIYRSLDGGGQWQVCMVGWNSRGGNGFAIDPMNANRAIGIGGNSVDIGTANGIYLSTNKAASWTQVKSMATENSPHEVEFDKSSYDAGLGYCKVAYYDAPSGIWKTTDGGSTWNRINTGFGNTRLKVHPTRGYVYVASNNAADHGFWRSTDGGATFTQISADYLLGLDAVASQPDNVYVSGSSKVRKSTDAGLTFSYVGNDYPNDGLPDNQPIQNVRVSPANPLHMACWYEGANYNWVRYYSSDGGQKWRVSSFSSANAFLPVNVRQGLFAWHPTDGNVVFNMGGDAVVKSTDGGATYRWSSNGENAAMVGGTFNISPTSPNTIGLSFQDYNGALTTNGGTTWTYVNPSGNGWGGYCYGGYAVDANVLWVGNAQSWGGTRELKVSRDGGATWNVMTSGGSPITWSGPDVSYSDPNNANTCFASNWRSTDKGVSWAAMSGCDGVFTANPGGGKELYGKKGNNVVKSTDGGATWTTVTTVNGGFSDLAYDQVRNCFYAASEDQLKKFANGTWTTLNTPPDQYGAVRVTTVAVDPVDPAVVYAGNHKDIYACTNALVRSTDAGATWTNLTVSSALTSTAAGGAHEVQCIRVHPTTREAWVSGQCYGMWKIGAPGSPNTPSTPTAGLVSGATYRLIARHSGKALDVAGNSSANKAKVQQYSSNDNSAAQHWVVELQSDGAYTLTHEGTSQRLDVRQNGAANGDTVWQYQANTADAQRWVITPTDGGYYKLVHKGTTKCLDVYGGPSATGEALRVVQWEYLGGTNQQWKFERLAPNAIVSGGVYRLTPKSAPSKCLDVNGVSQEDNDATQRANVQQWEYVRGLNQQWKIVSTNDGYYKLVSANTRSDGREQVLDLNGCSLQNNDATQRANVQQYRWLDNACQRWKFTLLPDGSYKIAAKCVVDAGLDKVLDVSGCSGDDNTNGQANVQQYDWLDSPCQHWQLTLLSAPGANRPAAPAAAARPVPLEAYPNPSAGDVTVRATLAQAGEVTLTLSDALGRPVLRRVVLAQAGGNQFSLATAGLPEGLYQIRLTVPGARPQVARLVVAK